MESPLSYLNAVEAQTHFEIKKENSILILTTICDVNLNQILKMLHFGQWQEIIFLNYTFVNTKAISTFKRGKILQFVSFYKVIKKLNMLAKKYKKVNQVFSGYYSNEYFLHMCNKINFCQCVLIDDGTMTISINSNRINEANFLFKRSLYNSGRIAPDFKLKIKYFLGLNDNGIKQVVFFTIYNIRINDFDRKIENKLTVIKSFFINKSIERKIYFLGSPIAESIPTAVSEFNFENLLKNVVLKYGADNLVYIPHRNENLIIVRKVQVELKFEILSLNVPIEYYLANAAFLPHTVVSFFTSALFNLTRILPDSVNIHSIRIPNSYLLDNSNKKNILYVYASMSSNERIKSIYI